MMKKLGLAGIMALSMVLVMAAASWAADSGFTLGLGYGGFDNETKLSAAYNNNDTAEPAYGSGSAKLLSPGNSYLLELNYDLNENWSFAANYNWGKTTLANATVGLATRSYDSSVSAYDTRHHTYSGSLKLVPTVLNLEAKYQWPHDSTFKLAGIIGYSDGANVIKIDGGINYTFHDASNSDNNISVMTSVRGRMTQKIHAPYIGGQVSVFPLGTLELGVAGRYLIEPADKVKIAYSVNGEERPPYSIDLTDWGDFSSWKLDIYGIATITENWSLKVDYSINYTCYDITINTGGNTYSGDLDNDTRQLGVSLRYKF